jgi:hypothetical protein
MRCAGERYQGEKWECGEGFLMGGPKLPRSLSRRENHGIEIVF